VGWVRTLLLLLTPLLTPLETEGQSQVTQMHRKRINVGEVASPAAAQPGSR
jgi:hypothetical protein